jgi:hypothetical protein
MTVVLDLIVLYIMYILDAIQLPVCLFFLHVFLTLYPFVTELC